MFHSKFVAFVLLIVAAAKAQGPTVTIQLADLNAVVTAAGGTVVAGGTVTVPTLLGEPATPGDFVLAVQEGPLSVDVDAVELEDGSVELTFPFPFDI